MSQELDAQTLLESIGVIRQAISSYIQTGALSVAPAMRARPRGNQRDNRCRNAARILRWLADNPKASPTEPWRRSCSSTVNAISSPV